LIEETIDKEKIMSNDETPEAAGRSAGPLNLLPAITFGVRIAALAGMALPAGALAAGLAGVFDDPASVMGPPGTTCCV
jgi:hypothetical protein